MDRNEYFELCEKLRPLGFLTKLDLYWLSDEEALLFYLTEMQKWFRDDKGISIVVTDQFVTQDYFVRVGKLFAQNSDYRFLFSSYEEALFNGIKEAVKLYF